MMIKKISQNEFNEVLNSKAAVVDFSATWCGHCKRLAPVLEEVAEDMKGNVSFFNVDVDEAPALAAQLEIQSVPALFVFKEGKSVGKQVGFAPKEQLLQFIKEKLD
ncbi:MAG: thioredoxin [Megasphaera sp.]|jgi:thioredoxin 1|uniref:thioredoxin n=1 Tax=Megasphaera sueciensis TaxID=349094 RepID=UPI003CFEF226|nr:thioredoxin [Megasphaera sp.]MCI1822756.1 thioredoxin [Megasphaera sp.]